MDFLGFFWIFWIFFGLFGFFGRFLDFGIFWNCLDFFFVIVTNVTTKCYHGYYWTPKMGQNSIKSSFFASAEGRSPPQELEVGPSSGPYLLVTINSNVDLVFFQQFWHHHFIPLNNYKVWLYYGSYPGSSARVHW